MVKGRNRRGFLVQGFAVVAAMTSLAGCETNSVGNSPGAGNSPGSAGNSPGSAGNTPSATTTTASAPPTRTTRQHTSITAPPENEILKIVNNTDKAICSVTLEPKSGNKIELLDQPRTHMRLKPHSLNVYETKDFANLKNIEYEMTFTSCEGDESSPYLINLSHGSVSGINSWS